MSGSASVHSIEALKDFRAVLALYGDDTLAALGAVDAEVRRTTRWLAEDRPVYWQNQIKLRRERVAEAKAEVFRRKLQKTPDHSPSLAEPMELLRRAEAALLDAERRLVLVRKWQPRLQQAALEYQASTRRIKTMAAGEVPRAVGLLGRLVDALEAYLRVAPPAAPSGVPGRDGFDSVAAGVLDADDAEPERAPEPEPAPEAGGTDSGEDQAG
jgi:hypothetical protein